ncbi:hypothetical protein [Oscillibacter sp.]|uniref:hypothetical protein n=1 Tax=Oscillibacter sp. TaxID=1945593 RepID=UPI0026089BE0|nr:hypothetical protein [Oscillibacter sp.]MDD3346748.1 hypothetical protein [Oscillibacter sp.]
MKRSRGLLVLAILIALCAGAVWLTLRVTAEYPALGAPISYPVNQVEGFRLSMEDPTWSPFRGYTLRYKIAINSEDVYQLVDEDSKPFAHLERLLDGQWYGLRCQRGETAHISNSLAIGGHDQTGFEASMVQKYDGYGTRLASGNYRLTIELRDKMGKTRYLAAEFAVK